MLISFGSVTSSETSFHVFLLNQYSLFDMTGFTLLLILNTTDEDSVKNNLPFHMFILGLLFSYNDMINPEDIEIKLTAPFRRFQGIDFCGI